ncbi:MAG: molybdopterin cofactor-binding domain-containing protein [Caldilineaceae bacterium]
MGRKLIDEMKGVAGEHWDVDAAEITFENGVFNHDGDSLSFKELAQIGGDKPVAASATVHPKEHGPASAPIWWMLEVDPETGKVTILRYTAAQDVGKAIHPSYVEGQIRAAVAQRDRLGSQRGVRLQRRRATTQRHCWTIASPTMDTYDRHHVDRRGAQRGPSLRRTWRGRVPIVPPAAKSRGQHLLRCSGRAHDGVAHVAAECAEVGLGEPGGVGWVSCLAK